MSLVDRNLLPVTCALTSGTCAAELATWREFNDDYLLDLGRTAGETSVHYPEVDDAITRLTQLVHMEQCCCTFATWSIDTTHSDLRLIVTGAEDALTALRFLEQTSAPGLKEAR